ncbi:MAG TPA: dienelactone hydrolase family protein [Chloroflexota bacterium]|jgi:carboxymethylenebutenolidase|nr:dienelactone hydrolase family protein [Chloroflexota bacterium]
MCYDSQARPPFPTERRTTAQGSDLLLTTADGNQFAAYAARPEQAAGAQVIILPDVRGLHQFYKDLALLFAEAGVPALAIDYFGRTAGTGPRDDSFEYMPHVQQLKADTFGADLRAAIEAARIQFGDQPTFTVGFCMGGALSLKAGADNYGLAGVIGFYAALSRAIGGNGTTLERAEAITVPVLGLFGGADQGIPISEVETLDQILDRTGVEHEIVIYPGAPHSFFDRRWTDFADASADAWKRILGFLERHSAVPAAR